MNTPIGNLAEDIDRLAKELKREAVEEYKKELLLRKDELDNPYRAGYCDGGEHDGWRYAMEEVTKLINAKE